MRRRSRRARTSRPVTKGMPAALTPTRAPTRDARTRAWATVAGRPTRRPSGSVHTATGVPAALPARTRTCPERGAPSAVVQRAFAHTTRAPDLVALAGGTSSVSRAVAECQAARCRARPSSTAWVAARPVTTPPNTVNTQAARRTQPSRASLRRRSGLPRHRHSHLFGPRNAAIKGILLTAVPTRHISSLTRPLPTVLTCSGPLVGPGTAGPHGEPPSDRPPGSSAVTPTRPVRPARTSESPVVVSAAVQTGR